MIRGEQAKIMKTDSADSKRADKVVTSTPAPRFYGETVTLAEHQLLKRVRQLAKKDGMVVVVLTIVDRDAMGLQMLGEAERLGSDNE